jgi:excisionase family DNA binding protein
MDKPILTLKEVAEYLKLSKLSLYRLLRERKIPGFKIGQQWRFTKDTIDKWIDEKIQKNQYKEEVIK